MRRNIICLAIVLILMIGGHVRFLSANGTLVPNAAFYATMYQERVGYVLSGAGDINGDGLDDFMIGTFHHATGGWDAGGVYLMLGRTNIDYGMNFDLNNADARFLGAVLEAVGFSISGRGDLNGDGYDDLLIGAPAGNDDVAHKPGRVYIVLGRPNIDWGVNCLLSVYADAIYEGEFGQDLAGRDVAFIGDLNKDGCDEFLCAAPYNDEGGRDAGKVYLIRGQRSGWSRASKLKNEVTSFYYPEEWGRCGHSVAGLGDVNQDGIPDFAISARGSKKVFIVFGRESMDWGSKFNLANADVILVPENILKDELTGWHVEGPGDVNGDSIADILISAIDYDKHGRVPGRGKVYLVLGRNGQDWGQQEINLYYSDASYIGVERGDQAGWGIGVGGDVNNDGLNDFFIGSWYNDYGYKDAGSGYLIPGQTSGWANNVNLGTMPYFFSGIDSVNYAGYASTIPGDIDGDEMDDYIMSAPYNSEVTKWGGKIYLFASQRSRHSVSGKIHYYGTTEPIPGTTLTISMKKSNRDTTDLYGAYAFQVYGKEDYQIVPSKAFESDIGTYAVTEYDAALIAQYSIGLDPFNHEIRECADANKDGRISAYDAAIVLKYSLNLNTPEDSYVGDWLFNPNPLIISNITYDRNDANFKGVIRGDVNSSWIGERALSKSAGETINIVNEEDDAHYIVSLQLEPGLGILSFAIDLEYDADKLRFDRIERDDIGDLFTIDYNGSKFGNLRVAGFTADPVDHGGEFIRVIFNKKSSRVAANAVTMAMRRINDARVSTSVTAIDHPVEETFELYQNYPNPFNGNTDIRYRIGEPGVVAFHIYDTIGRLVYEVTETDHNAGTHVISWNAKDLSGADVATGIYVAKLHYNGSSKVIKLMYLK